MTVRQVLLKFHLYLGLAASIFLVILGLTGSVMAFEGDIPHWLNSNLFYVQATPNHVPEQELVRMVEERFAPARVRSVQFFRDAHLARQMQLTADLPQRSARTTAPYPATGKARCRAKSFSGTFTKYTCV